MKRLLTAFVFLFFISCNQTQEPPEVKSADSIVAPVPKSIEQVPATKEDPIEFIREKVEKINTMKLEKKHFEFVCDVKMMVDYFYVDGKIVKIAVDFGTLGDSYAREGYYYDSGKLIFNYEFVEGGPACEGCIKTDEYRSYILDDKVIKYLKNKSEASCRKCDFSLSSRQYKLLQARTAEEIKAILCPQ
ncbi:hypothetical protein [Daejeonella lutea]|uniref:Lipoprotein n=1 Tax=Daejeonella lutea TaxID=572036 RepID=A0A1T5E9S3_9SPHI|nr:hypothetical protein [Daejeonella lutea]SKB80842.1 hypothetical protein SAMN05661099_2828 [Daejeonella lutea]